MYVAQSQGIQPLEHSTQSVVNEVASPNKQSEPVVSPANVHDQTTSATSLSSSEQVGKDTGTAAYYASLAIRARHADAKVLMIGEEKHLPYNRPPLSKELWWYGDEESANTLQYKGLSGKKRDGFFVPPSELSATSHGGVSLLRGRRVSKLCPDEKKAYLEDGHCITYNKCLIATGGKPKVLPELENVPENVMGKILYLRGVDDYRKLEEICKSSKSISIVGGGFLGSELAYSIQRKYKNVKITQVLFISFKVVAENGNLSEFLSKKASEALRDVGVDVITNAKVCMLVQVNGSQCITSDCVVVAVGIQPDTLVAEASGLEIDSQSGGISADAELRVRSDIWVAGDAASFYDKTLGRRRIEHWDNAQISGRLAGENMTGAGKAFWYQPAFFSKIAPQWQINAVGITDSSLPTVSVFAKDVRFYSFTAILRFFVRSIISAKCSRIISMSAVSAE
ncbi:unnamed protein product [Angiostrongylus costaricensis]|uniref:Pyr_redox_2 domain-containing protein n=1 Tax=Angiostrongylus costaricensis TaxID=334426 RepID=A0A3P7J1F7_ANGCS|nr:unnamed protein product [Angiostrongylus costaricensis]